MDIDAIVGAEAWAERFARFFKVPFYRVRVENYPEGEQKTTLLVQRDDMTGKTVLLALRANRFGVDGDSYHMRNWLTLSTLHRFGVKEVILLIPYMYYGRQNPAFPNGESCSLQVIADHYALYDNLKHILTVNSHPYGKPAGRDLQTFFPSIKVHDLNPAAIFAQRILELKVEHPIVVGPDEGSLPMISALGHELHCHHIHFLAERNRETGRKVIKPSSIKKETVRGRHPIIYDDVTGTGGTAKKTCDLLNRLGTEQPVIALVHIITKTAVEKLSTIDTITILTTDTFYLDNSRQREFFSRKIEELTIIPLVAQTIKSL